MMSVTNPSASVRANRKPPRNPIDRQLKIIKILLFATGLPCGLYFGSYLASNDFDLSAPLPPVAALLLSAVYLLANLLGWIALGRVMDEVEKLNNYKAVAVAAAIYLIIYPVWFLMWLGGFVVEPIHWLLFLLFWASLAASALYYRFR